MKRPILSIIITNYNRNNYLPFLLHLLSNQYNKNIEIILIDDGSNDSYNPFNNIKGLEIHYILNKENKGIGYCRELGLKKANGKYFVFIDSDDFISEKYIKIILDAIKKYSDLDIIQFGYIIYPNLNKTDYEISEKSFIWDKIFKKEWIRKNKIHFTNDRCGEDIIFLKKCYEKNPKIGKIPYTIYYYNLLSSSLTRK